MFDDFEELSTRLVVGLVVVILAGIAVMTTAMAFDVVHHVWERLT